MQIFKQLAVLVMAGAASVRGQEALISTYSGTEGLFWPRDIALSRSDLLYVSSSESWEGNGPEFTGNTRIVTVGPDGRTAQFLRPNLGHFGGILGFSLTSAGDATYLSVRGILTPTGVRRIDSTGATTTVGNGSYQFRQPVGVRAAPNGDIVVADKERNQIVRFSGNSRAQVIAGTGIAGRAGDGGPASQAQLNGPTGVSFSDSSILLADTGNSCIRRIDAAGTISTVAGRCGVAGYSGDGGPATDATLNQPQAVIAGNDGTLYIADTDNSRIRRVNGQGVIETIAGSGPTNCRSLEVLANDTCFAGDGGLATRARLGEPRGLALDSAGRLYVADFMNNRVRQLTFSSAPSGGGGLARPTVERSRIVNAASFMEGLVPGSWATLFGSNFSVSTSTWDGRIDANGEFPTVVGDVRVTIDGQPAFISFVSPNQINLQVPSLSRLGLVPLTVSNSVGTSDQVTVNVTREDPALFLLTQAPSRYPAAIRASDGKFIGRPGLFAGVETVPARPSDTVLMFGTGFGPTAPSVTAGKVFNGAAPLADVARLQVRIGGVAVRPSFAGLSSAGLYQFNVTIPELSPGEQLVEMSINGKSIQSSVQLFIGR